MLSSCVMLTYPLHTNYVAWYDLVRIVAVYIATSFSWVVLERRITADLITVHGPKERMIHTDKGQKVGQMQNQDPEKENGSFTQNERNESVNSALLWYS